MHLLTALLAASLTLPAGAGRAQLLPFGEFAARDGRPGKGLTWKLDDARGQALAASVNAIAARTPIVIDYEHQTLLAQENGQPAPAAGWIKQVEWVAGQGLFATVEWTERAKGFIAGGEYRFISPVITYAADGQVTGLLNAALVNYPALVGMEPVVAQLRALNHAPLPSTHPEPRPMDLLALLRALFALPDATPEQIHAHAQALKAKADTAAAQVAQLAQLKTVLGLPEGGDVLASVSALKTKAGQADTAEPAMALLKTMQTQVAALTAQLAQRDLDELVDGAITAGKFLPAQREQLIQMGQANLAQLKSFVEASPVIATALLNGQTGGKEPGKQPGAGGLTADEMAVCKAMGLTPEQFKAGAAA